MSKRIPKTWRQRRKEEGPLLEIETEFDREPQLNYHPGYRFPNLTLFAFRVGEVIGKVRGYICRL